MSKRSGPHRLYCQECGEVSATADVLRAPHPFIADRDLCGCPLCFEAENLVAACEMPDCPNASSSGTPLLDGRYVFTCHHHKPEDVPA